VCYSVLIIKMLVSPSDETCFIYLRTVVLDTPENKPANIGRSKKNNVMEKPRRNYSIIVWVIF
jgi:hypothetical protein